MDSVDFSVLNTLLSWQKQSAHCWLATVIQTFGSSPRPPGAMLALRADGSMAGSVSGGCIEDNLAERVRQGGLSTKPEIISYGVSQEEAQRSGLPCGGSLIILLEPVHQASWVAELLQRISCHELVARQLDIETGNVTLSTARRDDDIYHDPHKLITIHGPRWRLLIIGAGEISGYLARMAQALDYQVTVCDPREEFRQAWSVPDTLMRTDMPDDAVLALEVDSRTAIVALTHDPKLDDMALLEALKTPAFYVGALGSKTSNAKRRERLALFDLTPDQIDRLHGPVGLSIGSRTPPEIAIAILAHLISIRRYKPLAGQHQMDPLNLKQELN